MQASILQRILVIIFLIGAVVLGLVVASGFLILALLLVPVFLIRLWLHKKQFEKVLREQQAHYRATHGTSQGSGKSSEQGTGQHSEQHSGQFSGQNKPGSSSGGTIIEGEVLKKSEEQKTYTDPER